MNDLVQFLESFSLPENIVTIIIILAVVVYFFRGRMFSIREKRKMEELGPAYKLNRMYEDERIIKEGFGSISTYILPFGSRNDIGKIILTEKSLIMNALFSKKKVSLKEIKNITKRTLISPEIIIEYGDVKTHKISVGFYFNQRKTEEFYEELRKLAPLKSIT